MAFLGGFIQPLFPKPFQPVGPIDFRPTLIDLRGEGAEEPPNEGMLRDVVFFEASIRLRSSLEDMIAEHMKLGDTGATISSVTDEDVPKCLYAALTAFVELALGHTESAFQMGQLAFCEARVMGSSVAASSLIDVDESEMLDAAILVTGTIAQLIIVSATEFKRRTYIAQA